MSEASRRRPFLRGTACGLAAFAVVSALSLTPELERAEHGILSLAYRHLGPSSTPSDEIVLLLIDSTSLAGMRRIFADVEQSFPWRRLFWGALADFLKHAGARAVAFDLDLSGPTPHDTYVTDSAEAARVLRSSGIAYLAVNLKEVPRGAASPAAAGDSATRLEDVEAILDRASVRVLEERRLPFEEGRFHAAQVPWGPLSEPGVARGLGVVNADPEIGKSVPRTPLLVRVGDRLLPSLPLAVFLGLRGGPSLAVTRGGSLRVGDTLVPLAPDGRLRIDWLGPEQTFRSFPVYETIQAALADHERRCPPGTCDAPLYWNDLGYASILSAEQVAAHAARFRDKIVLVGANASELGDIWSNPFSASFPGVEVHATVLSNLLGSAFLSRASRPAVLLLALGLSLAAAVGAAGLGGERRGLILFALLVAALLAVFCLAFRRLLWIDLGAPLLAACLSYASITLVQYFTTGAERRKLRSAFDKVVHPTLVEELIRHPETLALGGDSRRLTVLFSDLKDFTGLAERLGAKELVATLNDYFEGFAGIVLPGGAYLDKYIGDGVMVVWGAPVPDRRHAVTACRAALRLRDELDRVAWRKLPAGGSPPLTRVGINSGEMIVGMVGSEKARHYTVMGDEVVIASRLEGANKIYGTRILIGQGCEEECRGEIVCREVDTLILKGRQGALRVHEPICPAGELSDRDREKLEAYARGLERYRARAWREAIAGFEEALALDPGDGPARVLCDRCRAFEAEPPPEGWSGEHRMSEK